MGEPCGQYAFSSEALTYNRTGVGGPSSSITRTRRRPEGLRNLRLVIPTCVFAPPETGIVKISMFPNWFETCATNRPSGDTAGANSSRGVLVIDTGLPPLDPIRYSSKLPAPF